MTMTAEPVLLSMMRLACPARLRLVGCEELHLPGLEPTLARAAFQTEPCVADRRDVAAVRRGHDPQVALHLHVRGAADEVLAVP